MVGANGVLVIYTGGTIGSLPKDPRDPLSPLVPAHLDEVMKVLPNYDPREGQLNISGHMIRIGTESFEEPIDSSNIQVGDWIKMARIIREHYNSYEGFVILHGTDTLAYSASALSFMLSNVSKPIIITGSQRPIGETRSDAVQNLVTSVEIAAAKSLGEVIVPEVCVFFRAELYRGCRTTKLSASSFNAFTSPNYPPLGQAGEHIEMNERLIRAPSRQALLVNDCLESNVAALDLFPGMSTELLRNILTTTGLRGVVMQTFGAGNAPTTPEFLDVIENAVKDDRIILDVTQCQSGEVELGLYDVSAGLLSRGVISGMDLTPEAALTKMMTVLGTERDTDIAKDLMQLDLRGEQRQSIFNLHFPSGKVDEEKPSLCVEQERPMTQGPVSYNYSKLDRSILRIMGLKLLDVDRGRIELKFYMDLPDANEGTLEKGNEHFLGRGGKLWNADRGDESIFITVTEAVKRFVYNRHKNTITVVNTGGHTVRWDRLEIACFVSS